MQITINGEKTDIEKGEVPLSGLLVIQNVESPEMVSVQVNGEIVDRSDYDTTIISENDEVEFLYFMGVG